MMRRIRRLLSYEVPTTAVPDTVTTPVEDLLARARAYVTHNVWCALAEQPYEVLDGMGVAVRNNRRARARLAGWHRQWPRDWCEWYARLRQIAEVVHGK